MKEPIIYVTSLNGEEWEPESFTCYYSAIEHVRGLMYESEDDIKYGYVGVEVPYEPRIDADRIIEQLSEDSYNDSPDYGDQWLVDIPNKDTELLQEILDRSLKEWIFRTNNYPHHYNIIDKTIVFK